jgi:hypothetical protein
MRNPARGAASCGWRVGALGLLTLLGPGCVRQVGAPAHAAADDEELLAGASLGPPLRIDPEGLKAAELSVSVVPPDGTPSYSCAAIPGPQFACGAPRGWFRGPGSYQLMAEQQVGATVHRLLGAFEVREGAVALRVLAADPAAYTLAMRQGPAPGRPGALAKEQIAQEIRRHRDQVTSCFESALFESRGLSARVLTTVEISADGQVRSASAQGAKGEPAMVFCMLSRILKMRFPAPGGPVQVRYPWVFKERDGAHP